MCRTNTQVRHQKRETKTPPRIRKYIYKYRSGKGQRERYVHIKNFETNCRTCIYVLLHWLYGPACVRVTSCKLLKNGETGNSAWNTLSSLILLLPQHIHTNITLLILYIYSFNTPSNWQLKIPANHSITTSQLLDKTRFLAAYFTVSITILKLQ